MIRILVGGFLIAHGLVHLAVWATPMDESASFYPSHSWLLGSAKGLSVVIAALATVILVSGGVALFAHAGVWRPLVIGAWQSRCSSTSCISTPGSSSLRS
jgi:hypothetical protein